MTEPNDIAASGRPRARRFALMLLIAALIALLASSLVIVLNAYAEDVSRSHAGYVTPFPADGVYKVMVVGDSLAEGTYLSLTSAFRGDRTLQFFNESKYGTGFSRRVHIGRDREFDPALAQYKPDIVVVVVGATDALAPILEENAKHAFGTPRWTELYRARLDAFLARLKRDHIAVYWVGLPIMRDPRVNENMNTLNDMFRERSHVANAKFIDTWNGFVDQYGNFADEGPGVDGAVARLRSNDGIRFTPRGYDKLANYVEREIRRDLIAARSERNTPLAGDVEEQNDISKKASAAVGDTFTGMSGETADVTRRQGGLLASSAAVFGELIASDRPSGLTLLSSVTRINDPSLAGGQHSLPLNLRPYYRVLVKGEAVQAKPGRADHFSSVETAAAPAPAAEAPAAASPLLPAPAATQ